MLSYVQLFVTPWTAAHQASLSITNSWSLLKLMSIESVMPSTISILCCPLLLQPSIFPRIRVFSNESVLCIRWPKYWSFSFSISPYKEYWRVLISLRVYCFNLLAFQFFILIVFSDMMLFSAPQSQHLYASCLHPYQHLPCSLAIHSFWL